MILHAYEQHEAARQWYRQALDLDADSSRWPYLLGIVHSELGGSEESIRWFRQSLERHPPALAGELRLAAELLKSGDDAESHSIYSALLSEDPQTPAAHLGLARIEVERGDPRTALEHCQRAAARLSDYGPLHYALALVYRELGDQEAARSSMALFERLGPTRQPPFADPLMDEIVALKQGSYLYHLNQGRRLAAAERPNEAIAEYLRAAEIEPRNSQAHVNLIAEYATIGEYDKADEHFQRAVDINPDSEEGYYNLGTLRTIEARFPEAVEAFRSALEVNPFSAEARNSLGYALEQVRRYDDAVREYRAALEYEPAHRSLPEAVEAFRSALEVNPFSAEARNSLGYALEQVRRYDDAVREYRAALEYEPAHRMAHFNLGRRLFGSGETEQGIRHLEQTLSPEDEQTPQFLLVLARAYRSSGKSKEAVDTGHRARALAETFGQRNVAGLAAKEFGAR